MATVTVRIAAPDGPPPDIPANALDRASFGSTRAWIDAMNGQNRPGKVGGPSVWDAPPRTPLTQSIYGYGTPKPIFRGPAASFLYPQAPDILVTGVRFENISMPFISSDDTVDDDWGDNLIPSKGYAWNYAEYSFASLRYNTDLRNLAVTHCEFDRCGVCIMLVRHFRVHDGLTFSDNVVRDGMGCVTVLGYRFQRFVMKRNDIRAMRGSQFAGGSANHTETAFMLGGINNPLRADFMGMNSVTVSNNKCVDFTSSHPQNNKNAAVFLDVRQGGNILAEDNLVRDCFNTNGSNDANAVYLKSRFNIQFRRNTYINCGARPISTTMGSETQIYGFKGGSEDIISEDDVFETGPRSGNAPWISCGTASNVRIIRPTFRGWRNEGAWGGSKGRPGVPCLIHHWSGSEVKVVEPTAEDCGWSGPRGYLIAHRDRASGLCAHQDWRSAFNGNQPDQVYQGSGGSTITLTDCRTRSGAAITVTKGA